MKTNTDRQAIDLVLNRGVITEILPSRAEFLTKLLSGERLKIYLGVDPTSTALHLSHAKNYMVLEELRQLGHEVIILFGDFTARIGDPSGRNEARPQLSAEEIKTNVTSWLTQIKPLLNFADQENPPRVVYNSEWLGQLNFGEILGLASNFTVQQMIERDMFDKRWRANEPIYLHEFLYPLMQGYDSVALEVDAELCGNDQTFNALAGRMLLKRLKGKDKFVIVTNLMANPKTGALMSKSRGTGVFLSSPAGEMFGAIMAEPDEMIEPLFINCTRLPLETKAELLGLGPRQAKAEVAHDIVARFYGAAAAAAAEASFDKTFRDGATPDDLLEISLGLGGDLVSALIEKEVIASRGEWRRLVEEGAIRTGDNEKIEDPHYKPTTGVVLKIGKRRFVKIKTN